MPDNRVHNYPPRWNAAPSQELLVIRRNHQTGEVSLDPLRWGLIPYWCQDPNGGRKPINAKCETADRLPMFRDAYRRRRCNDVAIATYLLPRVLWRRQKRLNDVELACLCEGHPYWLRP